MPKPPKELGPQTLTIEWSGHLEYYGMMTAEVLRQIEDGKTIGNVHGLTWKLEPRTDA